MLGSDQPEKWKIELWTLFLNENEIEKFSNKLWGAWEDSMGYKILFWKMSIMGLVYPFDYHLS